MFLASIAFPVLMLMSAQAPERAYFDKLNQFAGNKVLLLGDWPSRERAAWNGLLNTEGIFEYDIRVLDAPGVSGAPGTFSVDSRAFEDWLKTKFALGRSRWVLLDALNQVVAQGVNIPGAEELIHRFEAAGLISPVKQLRSFLRVHPDQSEARTDLLKQLRRRAVKLTTEKMRDNNGGAKDGLDPETDLIIWASLAQEVDTAFGGSWQGLLIPFFRAEEESQQEKHSPTMKSVFTRHIGKVEAALLDVPNSQSLWDIWAWMARSLENRPWQRFLKNINSFTYPGGLPCPAPNVAAWLVREARAASDWEQVAELAKTGIHFRGYPTDEMASWIPGGWISQSNFTSLEGYPIDSAYIPLLESLLRLNRLEEANRVFEDLIFSGEASRRETLVNMARSAGHANLAQTWRTSAPDKSIARLFTLSSLRIPHLVLYSQKETPNLPVLSPFPRYTPTDQTAADVFGWPRGEERWALLDSQGRLAVEGKGGPSMEIINEALEKMGYRSSGDLARDYLRNHPNDAYAHYVLASDLSFSSMLKIGGTAQRSQVVSYNQDGEQEDEQKNEQDNEQDYELNNELNYGQDYEQDYALWGDCAKEWLAWYENDVALIALSSSLGRPDGELWILNANSSDLMKTASGKILPKLENALKQQPMSGYLWGAWLSWRRVGGNTRPFAPLLAELAPSPLLPPGSFPPPNITNAYYNECIRQEWWAEAAKLLRQPWEQDLATMDVEIKQGKEARIYPHTWTTGKLLISVLLRDGKTSEAEDVVEAWISRGGKFDDVTELIALAKQLGYTGLVDKWGKMAFLSQN